MSNVVAHVADGAKANESLSHRLLVEFPMFVAMKFLKRTAYFTLEAVALMHLLSQFIPAAFWNAVAKVVTPRAHRDEFNLKFHRSIVTHNGLCAG